MAFFSIKKAQEIGCQPQKQQKATNIREGRHKDARRQRRVDGTHRVRFLPPNAPDKARLAEQRKCLSNARLAAHSGLMDIAQAWVARATGYCPVSQRSLVAIRRSYEDRKSVV